MTTDTSEKVHEAIIVWRPTRTDGLTVVPAASQHDHQRMAARTTGQRHAHCCA